MVFHYVNFIAETNAWWLRRIRPVRKKKKKNEKQKQNNTNTNTNFIILY